MVYEHYTACHLRRVSSDQQAQTHTIDSQVAGLRDRVRDEGFDLSEEMEFLDDGYSGTILVRPALERLRDVVAAGALDRLYVHSPDRLARNHAYQVVLVDEFRRSGVEVVFLNRELGQSPKDDLLLQVQGMIAEYERAKIIERNRRGKRHAARSGSVSVLSCAPYGYRYVTKREGNGEARNEIDTEEARVVKQILDWFVRERVSLREVSRRLTKAGEKTRKGKTFWDRAVIWEVLRNTAYVGEAAFGKTRTGSMLFILDQFSQEQALSFVESFVDDSQQAMGIVDLIESNPLNRYAGIIPLRRIIRTPVFLSVLTLVLKYSPTMELPSRRVDVYSRCKRLSPPAL